MEAGRLRSWETLFRRALEIIDSAPAGIFLPENWSFGGGTVLMRRYRHRFSKDIDIFVTGHGAPMTPSDVRDYARFNKDFLSAVQKAAKNGKTTDQIAAEWTLPDKHRTYMVDPTRLRANIKSIVDELKLESKSKPKQ